MKMMNLIPAPRLAARQQRIWRGRGVITCAAYAAVVAAVTLAARTVIGVSNNDMPGMLEAAAADIDRVNLVLGKVRGDLDATESMLRSSRAISEQPDWSLLLAMLAAREDGQVVLKAVAVRPKEVPVAPVAPLKPGQKAPAKPAAPPEPIILVSVTGSAISQAEASKFALRLESSGLFKQVSLLDTNRETFADLPLVSFRLECTVAGAADKVASPVIPAAKLDRQTAGTGDLRKQAAEGD